MVSMFNPRLTETLTDFPFARLNALIAPITPPAHLSMINMSVGEPQGAMPAFARQIVNDEIDGWNSYPPNQGIARAQRSRSVEWLTRRYRCPRACSIRRSTSIPTAGSKEGVYIIATVATPQQKGGAKPIVALPNPFYQAYLGGAVLSGAEPLLVNANAETGFLPDFDEHRRGDVEAHVGRLSLLARQSAGRHRQHGLSAEAASAMPRARHRAGGRRMLRRDLHQRAAGRRRSRRRWRWTRPGGKDPFRNLAVFHSLSKRSNAAGLRSGFMAGDPRLVAMMLRWRTYGGPQIPFAVQKASAALWREETHPLETREWYRKNFRVAEQILHNRFGYYTPGGGFFLWLDVGDGEEATRRLWGEAHVKVLPGAYVCRETDGINTAERYIRVALVHDEKTTREAMTRLAAVL